MEHDAKSLISGSGGGTRTPDTRIMIPNVSEENQSLGCKQDENSPQSNQIDSDGCVNISGEDRSYLHALWREICGPKAAEKKPPFRSPPPKHATVYFIGSEAGPIKIGYSLRPETRLRDLRLGSPVALDIMAAVEGSPSMERAYHALFAEHRLHGEWFAPHPDILAEIDRLTTKDPSQ